jgi:hypothetical protein
MRKLLRLRAARAVLEHNTVDPDVHVPSIFSTRRIVRVDSLSFVRVL